MVDLSAAWAEYYRELQPTRRREMLAALCENEPDDGANAYRRLLLDARHTDPRDPGREVDRMLFMCVSFIQLCQSARLFRRGAAKDARRAMSEMRFDEAITYGEAGEKALYWEIRNAAARYLSTCLSPGYNRGLFGLAPSRDAGRQERIARDIWSMTDGLARRAGLEAEMALWARAVRDSYIRAGGDEAALEAAGSRLKRR